ncbi:MAG: hypothetical protein EBR09_12745 [Proteobacteria bacterium]|nr:hypothetical protein [Pseudomonadota bacterium]
MFARLVSMLRDPTMSLGGTNDSFNVDIISPCALTYEIFGRMVRAALDKLETRELGAVRGVCILQSMLHNMSEELRDFLNDEDTLEEKQALSLIERAVYEAKKTVDDVMMTLANASQASFARPQRSDAAIRGEIEGAIVPALPPVLRIVIWLVHAVTNHKEIVWEDEQSMRVREDLRGLVLSLEISKTGLKSMIDMNEQLIAGFSRQMMLSERTQQVRDQAQEKLRRELLAVKLSLEQAQMLLRTTIFMVTSTEGCILQWGEIARQVTGIEQMSQHSIKMFDLFYDRHVVETAICTVKSQERQGVDVQPMRVFLRTYDENLQILEKKALVSLKAVGCEWDHENCVQKIMWIGCDLTSEYNEILKHENEMQAAKKQVTDMEMEISRLQSEVSQISVKKDEVTQALAQVQHENTALNQKLLESQAQNEKLVLEISKFRQFMTTIETLKQDLLGRESVSEGV